MFICFRELRFKNFLSTGNSFSTICLDTGQANIIIGKNGEGKSVIIDALSYVLYGVPYRNINKPLLINSINKKQLLVEIDFIANKKKYLIRRGMKPAVFEVYEDGKLIDQDDRMYDYQDKLEKNILKMNYQAFKQIVVIGKATYVPFMNLKTQDRRNFIEELLDLKVYTAMASILSKKNTDNKRDLLDVEYKITASKEKLNLIRQNIKKALKTADELVKQKDKQKTQSLKEKEKLDKDVQVLEQHIEKIVEGLDEKIVDSQKQFDKNNRLKIRVEETVKTVKKDLKFFIHTVDCPTCTQKIDNVLRGEKVKEKQDYLNDLEFGYQRVLDQLKELELVKKTLDKQLKMSAKLKQEVLTKKTSLIHVNHTLKEIDKELEQLQTNHSNVLDDTEQVNILKQEYEDFVSRKKQLIELRDLYKAASHILKDGGIKTQIIKQYVPIINQYIDKYLSTLDFYIQFEIDEEFNEIIKSRHRDAFVYNSFSEGEKLRIDIALIMVWRAIAKLRNSCNTNLLFLDEVFDSSLDSEGLEDLMKLINMLVTENQSVFIISHRGDQLVDRFENVLKVTKHKGFTNYEQE